MENKKCFKCGREEQKVETFVWWFNDHYLCGECVYYLLMDKSRHLHNME
jgi:hypothetical protein